MREATDIGGCGPCAFLKAGVGKDVDDDVIGFADERPDDAVACGPADREKCANLIPKKRARRSSSAIESEVFPISAAEPAL